VLDCWFNLALGPQRDSEIVLRISRVRLEFNHLLVSFFDQELVSRFIGSLFSSPVKCSLFIPKATGGDAVLMHHRHHVTRRYHPDRFREERTTASGLQVKLWGNKRNECKMAQWY
jgi:hypothetical protein